jgi:hypothetical protein
MGIQRGPLLPAAESFELAIGNALPGSFEDLLKRVEALHRVAAESLAAQPADDAEYLSAWLLLTSQAHEMLRGAAISSAHRRLFSGTADHPGSRAALLSRALETPKRRLYVIDSLIQVSNVTFACDILRRFPSSLSLVGAERGLAELACDYPQLLPPLIRDVDWSSLAERDLHVRVEALEQWADAGFEVIDLDGAFLNLKIAAAAAWMQLHGVDRSSVTHQEVIDRYEDAVSFLDAPINRVWSLQRYWQWTRRDSFSAILSTVAGTAVRIATEADGHPLATYVRVANPLALKPFISDAPVSGARRYVTLVNNPNYFLRDYPTREDITTIERNLGGFLKRHLADVPTSKIAQDIRLQLERARTDYRQLTVARELGKAALEASAILTAKTIATTSGADQTADYLIPFVAAVLHLVFQKQSS